MKMKRSRTGIALFLAAACRWCCSPPAAAAVVAAGGTGGGTPIAPVEFRSTKTYKRAQETENKPFYMEYWLGSNDSGEWVESKDPLLKAGSKDGKTYTDTYSNGTLLATIVSDETNAYQVFTKKGAGV